MPSTTTVPEHEVASEAARLQTADDIAARLQVPRSFVYRLARQGQIPTVRLGKYVRFDPAAIDDWLTERGSAA